MTKQEEIREGMLKILQSRGVDVLKSVVVEGDIYNFLHSQGVVIKVDDYLFTQFNSQNATVEPLIKEDYFSNERFERG